MVCVLCKLTDWVAWTHVLFLLGLTCHNGHVSLITVKQLTKGEWRELFDNGGTIERFDNFKP
jgi:hypothetical protein